MPGPYEADDVTLGEVARRVDRLENDMRYRFEALSSKIDHLSFVPAAVYSSDQAATNQRLTRLETTAQTTEARGWQIRIALLLAILGVPMSIAGGVITALLLRRL